MFDIENVDIKIKCVFLLSQSCDGIMFENKLNWGFIRMVFLSQKQKFENARICK